MIAWYVVLLTRYGKFAFGASRKKTTVWSFTFLVPPGVNTPLNADSAAEPPFLSDNRSNVAITSSAVKGWPLANFTPFRRLNAHCVAFAFDFQLTASSGASEKFCCERSRNSPEMRPIARRPWSANRLGSRTPVGPGMTATRIRPPASPAAVAPKAGAGWPIALRAAPIVVAERPRIVARRRKLPRSSSPVKRSSISVFSCGPACVRRYSSSALRVSLSIRPPKVVEAGPRVENSLPG